jgi:hypothetical protein
MKYLDDKSKSLYVPDRAMKSLDLGWWDDPGYGITNFQVDQCFFVIGSYKDDS